MGDIQPSAMTAQLVPHFEERLAYQSYHLLPSAYRYRFYGHDVRFWSAASDEQAYRLHTYHLVFLYCPPKKV